MTPFWPAAAKARKAAGEAVRGQIARAREDRARNGRSYAFSSLAPVKEGRERALARTLRGLSESPLARLPYVHFARFVVIDELKTDWCGVPRPLPRLSAQYLLFTADVTAPEGLGYELPGALVEELRLYIPDEVTAVWGECIDFPGTEDVAGLHRFFERSQLDTVLYYVGARDATVPEVKDALRVRDEFIAFATEFQATGDAALRAEYAQRVTQWI